MSFAMAAVPQTVELKLHLRADANRKLKERAAASGKDVADYAAKLIEDAVTNPSLDEVLSSVRERFAASGMSEDELSEFLEDAKHRRRTDRKKAAGG
jgi:hypothetical protein